MTIVSRHLIRASVIAAVFAGVSLPAQDLAGVWQGTLASELGTLRAVLQVARVDSSGWKTTLFSIDQSGFDHGDVASGFTFSNSSITIRFDDIDARFDGALTADGNSLVGNWSQNNESASLTFRRASSQTLWRDPLARSRAVVQSTADRAAMDFSALWLRACGDVPAPAFDTGFVFGHVTHLRAVQSDTSEYVQAAWNAERVPGDSAPHLRATVSRAHLKEDGSYAICGVPLSQTVSLRVVHAGITTPVITTRLAESRIVQRDLTLFATEADLAELFDTVVAGARPEAGVQPLPASSSTGCVGVSRARTSMFEVLSQSPTLTDATGHFVIQGVPAGFQNRGSFHRWPHQHAVAGRCLCRRFRCGHCARRRFGSRGARSVGQSVGRARHRD